MKKNILLLFFALSIPCLTHAASEEEINFITDKNKDKLITVDFSLYPTVFMNKEYFLKHFQKEYFAAGTLVPLKMAFKETFKIIILFEERALDPLKGANLKYIKQLIPELKAIVSICPKESLDQLIIAHLIFDNTHDSHAYVDGNLNIFALKEKNLTLKKLITKWPENSKYSPTSLRRFAPEYFEQKEAEKEVLKDLLESE